MRRGTKRKRSDAPLIRGLIKFVFATVPGLQRTVSLRYTLRCARDTSNRRITLHYAVAATRNPIRHSAVTCPGCGAARSASEVMRR